MTNAINWDDLVKDADLSGGGGEREPLPIGDYLFKILEVTPKTTSTGKTMFSVKAEVQEGTHKGTWAWDNMTISPESPKAMGFFFRKMAALGLPKEFFAGKPSTDQVIQAMSNRSFIGTIKHRPWNGKTQVDIEAYAPATGSTGPAFQAAPGAPVPPPPAAQAPAAPVAPAAPAPQAPPAAAPQYSQIGQPGPSQIGQAPAAPAADPWSNNAPAAPAVGEAWPAQGQAAPGGFAPPPAPPF